MTDIFQSYQKHKVLSHTGVLVLSALFAISINTFILNDARSEMIRASVLDTPSVDTINSDFSAKVNDSSIFFKNTHQLKDVKEFSFSVAYNPEVLDIGEAKNPQGGIVSEIKNEDGFINYIVTFSTPVTLSDNTALIDVPYTKLQEKTALLNLIQVNFKDSQDQVYLLSSGKTLF